jgi:hypothetical protein
VECQEDAFEWLAGKIVSINISVEFHTVQFWRAFLVICQIAFHRSNLGRTIEKWKGELKNDPGVDNL